VIDRLAPARRPRGRPIARHRWRDLLFLHWPVPAAALRPLVPRGLDVDEHEGTAYVGLVPFALEGVRFAGTPEALGLAFLETNVRTYVHAGGREPGVLFFSLDASSWLACAGARASYGLPYFPAAMRERREGRAIEHATRRRALLGRGPRCDVRYEPLGAPAAAAPGSLEHFLCERYLLHVERLGRVFTGQVHHAPYPLEAARVERCEEDLVAAAGIARPAGPPPLAHYARAVDVDLFAPRMR
jgi:hypothetical protein